MRASLSLGRVAAYAKGFAMIRAVRCAAAMMLLAAQPVWAGSFTVSFPAARSAAPLDGRLILLLSTDKTAEPKSLVDADALLKTPAMFGMNVEGLKPGQSMTVDDKAFGWPVGKLSGLKAGDYRVQAVLNRYETFRRGDGVTISLAPDKGEGQKWDEKPGNLYSKPVNLHWDPADTKATALSLDQEIAPITPKKDTAFIKHVTIQSPSLTKFWGRPMYLTAHVLVPAGFDTHPNAHYPLMVFHGHFPDDISNFRTVPPDPNLKPEFSERFHLAGYNRIQQEEAYANYKKWTAADFPRFLVVEIAHANPYYDDSYAVNSANVGPYGDAINKELIPEIEKRFRGLGAGWARFTYGGSTGGWEAMAPQVFYPDMYNGAFVACPDPIDFRAYTVPNIYKDDNMYAQSGGVLSIERPAMRNYLGEVLGTQRDANYQELVLGDRGRSGGQYDIWQAVFSPRGADGYPVPIFDKQTGVIDHKIADYWKEHYDLAHIIQRDWKTLGPKLAGKLHIYVGSSDTFFLNNAVYYAQDVLEGLKDPVYGGEVDYGDRAEHCWNGNHQLSNAYSRLIYNFQYLPKILARIKTTAPAGADLTSWRY